MCIVVLRNSLYFSITMENVHVSALYLCIWFFFVSSTKTHYRLHTEKTIQIHGKWWQRRTKTRNGTSVLYFNPFLTHSLFPFRQISSSDLSIEIAMMDFAHILPVIEQERVSQSLEWVDSPLLLCPLPGLQGHGTPFFYSSMPTHASFSHGLHFSLCHDG